MSLFFQGEGGKRALSKVLRNKPVQTFPGIHSTDPEYLRFTEELADRLSEALPVDIDEYGIAGHNGVSSDFYSLRNVAGCYMTPLNVPAVSNEALRDDLALSNKFVSPRHEQIARDLHRLCFSHPKPAALRINRDSSSVIPYFTTDLEVKKKIYAHYSGIYPQIAAAIGNGQLEKLFIDTHFTMAYNLGIRAQPDPVIKNEDGTYSPKPREVNSRDYARTAGASGQRIIADKSVVIDGHKVDGHFAMRVRTVYGLSACANYLIGAMFSELREHYLREYAFTWKHTTKAAITDKVRSFKYFMGADVKQYDQSVGSFLIDFFCDELSATYHDHIIDMVRMSMKAPYYTFNPNVGEKGGFWMGNPLDPNHFNKNYGLPSGIACNPDFGKWSMTFAYLCVFDDYFGDVLEFGLDKILRGEHPHYALLDMGDDAVLLSNSRSFWEHTHKTLLAEKNISPYFKIEREKQVAFLGNVFYRERDRQIHLCPSINSLFQNWMNPERSIGTLFRRNWVEGWDERNAHYAYAPSFYEASQILNDVFRKHYGLTPDSLIAREGHTVRYKGDVMPMTEADRIVMDDPTKLNYRFSADDLSPEILDKIVGTIPIAEIERFTSLIRK